MRFFSRHGRAHTGLVSRCLCCEAADPGPAGPLFVVDHRLLDSSVADAEGFLTVQASCSMLYDENRDLRMIRLSRLCGLERMGVVKSGKTLSSMIGEMVVLVPVTVIRRQLDRPSYTRLRIQAKAFRVRADTAHRQRWPWRALDSDRAVLSLSSG